MAEGENIGGVNVAVTLDYSEVLTGFNDLQSKAAQSASGVGDSFGGAASGVNTLNDAIQTLTASNADLSSAVSDLTTTIADMGKSADDTGGSLDTVAASAVGVGAAAGDADTKLSEMAGNLTLIGEALVITEGLKDFGSEALTAADNVTHADIALTTLTHDAEGAQITIEGLSQLGQSDGLAMPSLLSAATRMTAILPAGTDVVGLLGHIADGASVMGTEITSAVQRFDLMATAGTASGRTLTQLGLSLQSLSAAFNVVIPGADSTANSVAAMFKALADPDQRIAILTQALSGMGGVAAKVRDQTFGGEWTSLAAQWDEVMVTAGKDLMPLVTTLADFARTDIIPFVQNIVGAFTAMPEPVQEAAIAVGVLAAAAIPLTAGLAAFGLAVNGLNALLPAFTGLMEALGLAAETTAAEEVTAAAAMEGVGAAGVVGAVGTTAAASAMGGLGTAAEGAGAAVVAEGVTVTGLAGILGGILVTGLAAAAFGFIDLNNSIKSAESGYKATSGALDDYIQKQVTGAKSNDDIAAAQLKVNDALNAGVISLQQATTWTNNLTAEAKKLIGTGWSQWATDAGVSLNILGVSSVGASADISKINSAAKASQDAFTDAKAAYELIKNSFETGVPIVGKTAETQQEVNDAFKLMQTTGAAAGVTIQDLTGYQDHLQSSSDIAAASSQTLANKQSELQSNVAVTGQAMGTAQEKLDDLAAHYGIAGTDLGKYAALYPGLADAIKAAAAADDAYNTAVAKQAASMADAAVAQASWQTAALRTQALQLDLTASALAAAGADQAVVQAIRDMATAALDAAQTGLAPFKVEVMGQATPLIAMGAALDSAKGHLADVLAQWSAGKDMGKQYESALNSVLKAQIDYDSSTAAMAANSTGATDDISLLNMQLAAEKAKLDDLKAALQNGQPVWNQVQQTQKQVTSLQNQLNIALGQTPAAANAAAAGIDWVAAACGKAINQLFNLTAAMQSTFAAFDSAYEQSLGTVTIGGQQQVNGHTSLFPGQFSAAPGSAIYNTEAANPTSAGTPLINWGAYYQQQASAGVYTATQLESLIAAGLIKSGSYTTSSGASFPGSTSSGSTSAPAASTGSSTVPTVDQGGPIIGGSIPGLNTTVGSTSTDTGTTDVQSQIAFLQAAFDAAEANVQTVITAYDAGTDSLDQLNAATAAAASANDALYTAVNAANAATGANTSATNSLTTATAASTTAAQGSATASTNVLGAMTNLTSSVTQLTTATVAATVAKNVVGAITAIAGTGVVLGYGVAGTGGGTNVVGGTTSYSNNGAGGGLSFNFSGSTFGAGTSQDMVMAGVTQALRTAGARF